MQIEEKFVVGFPRDRVWEFLMNDVQGVISCVPGVEDVRELDGDTYHGVLKVKVGPVSAKFQGKVTVEERNKATYQASMLATGNDSKLSSAANAKIAMNLYQVLETQTEVVLRGDVRILGMLGQFGQGIIKNKAHALMEQFADRVRTKLVQV